MHLGNQIQGFRPVLLKGLRLQKFQATFSMRRVGSGAAETAFAFNASDQDDYDFLRIKHSDTKTAPTGRTQIDGAGQAAVSETKTNANMPALTSTSVLWVRVTHSGTTVTVKCADSEAGLSSAADCYSSSALRTTGGMLGFRPLSSTAQIDDLTVKSYNPSTSSFDVIEQQEFFTLDVNGYAEETLAHDANGNLSYDGVHRYNYDAWNRLVRIAKGYRDSSNTLQSGQTFTTIRYDGRGRRISKAVTGTGQWDATYHYYYDSDSLVETRNGSNQVLKQQVWGVEYIDELIQISINDDPDDGTESTCETSYWAMQDANYNVLGIVDSAGILKERYEYTPYGQRVVYFSPGVNDPGCYAPTLASRRVTTTLGAMPYGLNEFGHQGLMHDEESQLVYNRARYLHPVLGRFTSADPLGYVNSANLYEYVGSNPLYWMDPLGLKWNDGWWEAGKAILGIADSEVQQAFDQVAWDRTNGTLDGITMDNVDLDGYHGGNSNQKAHTFDGDNRKQAECFAKCMADNMLNTINQTPFPVTVFDGPPGIGVPSDLSDVAPGFFDAAGKRLVLCHP